GSLKLGAQLGAIVGRDAVQRRVVVWKAVEEAEGPGGVLPLDRPTRPCAPVGEGRDPVSPGVGHQAASFGLRVRTVAPERAWRSISAAGIRAAHARRTAAAGTSKMMASRRSQPSKGGAP